MGVVSLDAAGEPVYNFTNIDVLWDAHVRNGVAPLVELSFMPLALANCSSAARPSSLPACVPNGWVRRGVPFPPRRWDDWRDLVAATAAHAVDRYGLEEVQTWHWEVWNELWGVPGASETALGNYTRTFYAVSAEAIKGVDATLQVGGPASAGAVVLPAFIEEVEALGLPLDFVSSHYYGNARECPPGWGSNATLNGTAPPFQSGNGSSPRPSPPRRPSTGTSTPTRSRPSRRS